MKLLVAVDLSESTQTIVEKVEEMNKEYTFLNPHKPLWKKSKK